MRLFFILLLLLSNVLFAQKYFYNHYTIDDGLPNNTIYDIKESPSGIITLGTDNGISFFNGVNFENLNTNDGLGNPFVIGIQYNKEGDLYVGNYNGKFQIYKNGKFHTTSIPCSTINEVYVKDKFVIINQNTGNYIKAINKVITSLSYDYYTTNTHKHTKTDVVFNKVTIDKYKKSKIFYYTHLKKNIPIFSIGYESFWVDSKIHHSQYPITIPEEIEEVFIIKKRQLDWVLFTENYLYIVDFNSKIKQKVKLPFPLYNGINRFCAEIDKNNTIWLNLQKRGLFILDENKWRNIEHFINLKPNQNINKLFKDSKGRMWIATHENGLFCIPDTNVLHYFTPSNQDFFNSFLEYNNQLFACNRYELYKINNFDLALQKLPYQNEFSIGYINKTPYFLGINPEYHDRVIFENIKAVKQRNVCYISEIEILYYSKQELFYTKNKLQSQIAAYNSAQRFYKIKYYFNQILVNNGSEIYSARIRKDTLQYYKPIYKSNGFISDFIYKNDTLLVAENNKLLFIKNKVVKTVDQVNNVTFDNINKIINNENGIWLATKKGLFSLENNWVLNKYNYLSDNDVQDIYFKDNYLFVATTNGLNRIPISALQTPTLQPQIAITKYKLDKWFKIYNGKINLESNQEYLTLPVEVINYLSPKNQIVEYKIDKSNWVTLKNYSIDLFKIPYGKTTLEYRIKDANSGWNSKVISIYRAYPFYLQTGFFIVSGIIVILLLYILFQYKAHKIREENEKEIAQNTRIMELRQSALSAQMNPHFIFNSLNAIQYFVNSNQKEKSSEYLAKLSRLVRLFLYHASETFITLSEEIKRLELYISLEQLRFDNFECNLEIRNIQDTEKILIPNMIVQPFIENAILHGVSHLTTRDGRIGLYFKLTNQILNIVIEDNGFGINNSTQQSSHISKGLKIIEERLQIMQKNEPLKQFSIHYEIPFPENERKGHRVIIRLTID